MQSILVAIDSFLLKIKEIIYKKNWFVILIQSKPSSNEFYSV